MKGKTERTNAVRSCTQRASRDAWLHARGMVEDLFFCACVRTCVCLFTTIRRYDTRILFDEINEINGKVSVTSKSFFFLLQLQPIIVPKFIHVISKGNRLFIFFVYRIHRSFRKRYRPFAVAAILAVVVVVVVVVGVVRFVAVITNCRRFSFQRRFSI